MTSPQAPLEAKSQTSRTHNLRIRSGGLAFDYGGQCRNDMREPWLGL